MLICFRCVDSSLCNYLFLLLFLKLALPVEIVVGMNLHSGEGYGKSVARFSPHERCEADDMWDRAEEAGLCTMNGNKELVLKTALRGESFQTQGIAVSAELSQSTEVTVENMNGAASSLVAPYGVGCVGQHFSHGWWL